MKTKVTFEDVEASIKKVDFDVLKDGRTTVCTLTLDNDFTVRGESSCVDPANFDKALGEEYALKRAKDNVWQFLGFRLADALFEARNTDPDAADMDRVPPTTAALLIHEDGTSEVWMPKLSDDDEAEVPSNTMVVTALAALVRDAVRIDTLLQDTFGENTTVPDNDGVLAKAPGEYNTWEKRVWRRGFYAGQQDSISGSRGSTPRHTTIPRA